MQLSSYLCVTVIIVKLLLNASMVLHGDANYFQRDVLKESQKCLTIIGNQKLARFKKNTLVISCSHCLMSSNGNTVLIIVPAYLMNISCNDAKLYCMMNTFASSRECNEKQTAWHVPGDHLQVNTGCLYLQ